MDNKDEFNVMSKISMAKVMREHSYTDNKIDYIIQCAKNALKKHKDIPAEVDNGVWYNVDYAVEKTIVEGINFIKTHKLYDLLKNPDDVYVWRGDCTDFTKNSFLCNAVESEVLNGKKIGLEFKYDNNDNITITLFNDVKNLMTVKFNFIDLYDWIDVGTFRMSRVYIDNEIYRAKGFYRDENSWDYHIVYTF